MTDMAGSFGVSSRTLRYYEQAGLLWSHRLDDKQQRYYDPEASERLRQILVLRKLQIPVRDIAAIYKDEGLTALIKAFVDKLESLDSEIAALAKLRELVDDFLRRMLEGGVKKISAIPLLYEEMEKRLAITEKNEPVTFDRLTEVSREALKLHDVRVARLPPMRVLTSRLKTGQVEGLDENLFAKYGMLPEPGFRNCFFRKEQNDEWVMLMKIPQDYENVTGYIDEDFRGGLYAVATSFFEDMDDTFILLRDWASKSDVYEPDNGRRDEFIEEIMPRDIVERFNRYQQDVFVPIKIRQEKE